MAETLGIPNVEKSEDFKRVEMLEKILDEVVETEIEAGDAVSTITNAVVEVANARS